MFFLFKMVSGFLNNLETIYEFLGSICEFLRSIYKSERKSLELYSLEEGTEEISELYQKMHTEEPGISLRIFRAKARTCWTNESETYWTSIVRWSKHLLCMNQVLGWALGFEFVCLCLCLPFCLSVCLSVCLRACLSVCLLPCAATSFFWPDALSLTCSMSVYF